jgi:hypothetical protein
LNNLRIGLSLGYCFGGYVPPRRNAEAAVVTFDPINSGNATVAPLGGIAGFWGAPKIFDRLISAKDPDIRNEILLSGHRNGSSAELDSIFAKNRLTHIGLPIREAVDFVHFCIYTTIKALKFSYIPQICGGPIEVATVTTDRKFRWARHKEFDSAILDRESR